MISAILDTNVLASGTTIASTAPGQILDAWRAGQFELVLSTYIIDELKQTFQQPYFQNRLTANDIASFIDLLENETTVVPIITNVHGVATHPEDDFILATAVSARADYLVSGDKKFLQKTEPNYHGIILMSPADFIKILNK